MDGVEILNQVDVPSKSSGLMVLLLIFLFILVCFFIAAGISACQDDFIIGVILIVVGLVLFIGMCFCAKKTDRLLKQPSGIIEYQVTIDDTVSMNEFNKKYEVIEVNGRIYTVREK